MKLVRHTLDTIGEFDNCIGRSLYREIAMLFPRF